ncbi:MAG: hypothetical protein M3460_29685 [Actinomycetota bacterium]|nr:hypothetical protein [Actinomycetota bacterium]
MAVRGDASLALQGDVQTARAVLSELDALRVPPLEIGGPEVPRARAWTEVMGAENLIRGL